MLAVSKFSEWNARVCAMIRRLIDAALWYCRDHRGPGQKRHWLWQLVRQPMNPLQLTVDPRGEWSRVQAERVLAIINPQAAMYGLRFKMVDVTVFGMPAQRFILAAHCVEHEEHVAPGKLCASCQQYVQE